MILAIKTIVLFNWTAPFIAHNICCDYMISLCNIYLELTWDTVHCGDHYNDVIMGAMASQIISLTIVYSTIYSGADQITSKLRVTGLCVGNSPGTGEFPAQMASNAENVSMWWRHHVLTTYVHGDELKIAVPGGIVHHDAENTILSWNLPTCWQHCFNLNNTSDNWYASVFSAGSHMFRCRLVNSSVPCQCQETNNDLLLTQRNKHQFPYLHSVETLSSQYFSRWPMTRMLSSWRILERDKAFKQALPSTGGTGRIVFISFPCKTV